MDIVYAKTTAMVGPFRVNMGSYWPATDPLVVANPSLFSPDPREGNLSTTVPIFDDEAPVEMVTGGPGERRAQVGRRG